MIQVSATRIEARWGSRLFCGNGVSMNDEWWVIEKMIPEWIGFGAGSSLKSKRDLLKEHETIWPGQEMHVDLGWVLTLIHLEGVLSRDLVLASKTVSLQVVTYSLLLWIASPILAYIWSPIRLLWDVIWPHELRMDVSGIRYWYLLPQVSQSSAFGAAFQAIGPSSRYR